MELLYNYYWVVQQDNKYSFIFKVDKYEVLLPEMCCTRRDLKQNG